MTSLDTLALHGTERARKLRQALEAQRDGILRSRRLLIDESKHPQTEGGLVLDDAELSEADVQEELDLALLEMHAETLDRIEDALGRLACGNYGNCADCGDPIPARRLEALPFAARCRSCEEDQERAKARRASAPSWDLLEPLAEQTTDVVDG
jgi:DnaK suppressor protein